LREFQPENAPKAPEPAVGAYSTPPDLLAGFKSGNGDMRRRKEKTREGWTTEGGEQRKQRRGGEEEEGRKRGG